jgi:very-short-patch-repair endonuclease
VTRHVQNIIQGHACDKVAGDYGDVWPETAHPEIMKYPRYDVLAHDRLLAGIGVARLSGVLKISCAAADNVNVAFYQNAVPIIRELVLENGLGRELADIHVHLASEPPFLSPGVWHIDRIADQTTHHIRSLDLKLDPTFLAGLNASRRGELRIRVEAAGEWVGEQNIEINLLPPSHWGGVNAAPELLAAFVRPTDPSVDVILREASDKLAAAGRDPAVDGYRKGTKGRSWEIADAIWAALVSHAIAYVLPPKSFERSGQQVRGPSDILSRKVGTCLDLTLLYASCLEQAGLNPLLVMTEGHAFVGVWLVDEDFSSLVVDDAQMLRKRVQLEEMVMVETTLLTGSHPARFRQAVEHAKKLIAEEAEAPFELAIDVRRARSAKIRPLDLGTSAEPTIVPKTTTETAQEVGEVPQFEEDLDQRREPAPDKALDRLETWKRNLLDLTLKNRLLNFKDSKSTIAIECPEPATLEDKLTEGVRFKLLGKASVLDGSDGRDAALLAERQNEDGRRAYVLDAMARGDLHTNVAETELEARLTDLYRAARLAFEEGGANILYLCLGFLKWTPQDGAGPYRAPLILIPVQLERKSVRSGFKLALHEDEARFNPTLLQMLKQDFDLTMPEFDGELPAEGSGIDVDDIWKTVRRHVKSIKGWEVTEQVVLATLSFTKYLMWKDLVDRTDILKRNPVVRHLIDTPTHTYEGSSAGFIDANTIDQVVDPIDLFAPLSADSSQVAAIVAAQRGADYVLFGPPGTGKSQTIANAILNCLAHKKTVLFVSQKTAALEVVRQRLQGVGLGNYCLEVHSTKAQKSSVLEQLATAWRDRNLVTEEHWSAAAGDLRKRRDQLNQLVSALHRRRANGMTAYEAFGRVIADRDRLADVGLTWPAGTVHSPEALAQMREICVDVRTALEAVGSPVSHPLRGIEQTKWTPAWVQELQRLIDRLQLTLREMRVAAEALAASIGLTEGAWDPAHLPGLATLVALMLRSEASDGVLLLAADAPERIRALNALTDVVRRMEQKASELSADYDLKAAWLDLGALQREWADACASNFLVRGGRRNKVRLNLKPYCPNEVPEDIGRDLVVLQDLATLLDELEDVRPLFKGMGSLWRGVSTDVSRFDSLVKWAKDIRDAVQAFPLPGMSSDHLLAHVVKLIERDISRFQPGGQARKAFDAFHQAFPAMHTAAKELGACIGLDNPEDVVQLKTGWIKELFERTNRWKANVIKAPQWTTWRAAAGGARHAGLSPLIDAVEDGSISGDSLAGAFDFAYARWIAETIVNEDEVLSGFLAEKHEAAIGAFIAADKKVGELAKQIVKARIGASVPTQTNFGKDPEWGTLAREINKKARHMPLRQLFGRIPNVLTQLAPCVMMSPLSIAQYLPAEAKPFDVVIFDEASQIPVWDAIGAIARGAQVIIVGDPEQLPPTSVGQRGADDEDDDGSTVQSQQSILDECLASNIPSMRLSWHYRSRHESLIAFSNAKYYRGELMTFPSPVTRDTSVRYVHVEGGVYERGGAKVNRKEAEAVVAEVVKRMKNSTQSVGVVTFNGEQQRLIENMLDQARRSDPSLEAHFDRNQTREPILVKNIENVQGDERDIIIFSVAVGPDKTGRVTAQISSLNGEGGHRRLNVAITRARRELLVFATLRPEQIDLGRTSAKGVVDFKHFLEFAEHGARAIAEAFSPTGRETESPFEDAVMRALQDKGWQVHPQVGVSFFRIDLGIVHPDFPGRYLAGVECDGATYHRSATARDRDRLREMVLTDLGWRIRRIWSTEWWMDATSAFGKIHARLEADLAEDRASRAAPQPEPTPQEQPVADITSDAEADAERSDGVAGPAVDAPAAEETVPVPTPANDSAPPEAPVKIYARGPESTDGVIETYVMSDPGSVVTPDRERFYDVTYRAELRKMVDHVVDCEGPIFFDVLVDRLARAHGFQRSGENVRQIIGAALGTNRFITTKEDDRDVIWPLNGNVGRKTTFRGDGGRAHTDIPLPELAGLANSLHAQGLEAEELVRGMQEHFKLGRLAATTRERFENAISAAEIEQAG